MQWIIPLIVQGVQLVVGAITGGVAAGAENKRKKEQAAQLQRNIIRIEGLVNDRKLSVEQGLQRIDSMIGKTKGDIKDAINNQLRVKAEELKDTYKRTLDKVSRDLRIQFTQRRVEGGAYAEATGQIAEGLSRQFTTEQRQAYESAQSIIAQQVANLDLSAAQLKEGKITAGEAFQTKAIFEMMQLGNMATELEATSGAGNIATGILSGLTGQGAGISNIIASAMAGTKSPGEPNILDAISKGTKTKGIKLDQAYEPGAGLQVKPLYEDNLETMFS